MFAQCSRRVSLIARVTQLRERVSNKVPVPSELARRIPTPPAAHHNSLEAELYRTVIKQRQNNSCTDVAEAWERCQCGGCGWRPTH